MKKDNTIYYIIGAGALVGGAYYAYKKGLLDKILGKSSGLDMKAIDEENKLAAKENQVETSYTPLTNPNSFQSKVMKIQDDIGARSDGKVGNQTNTMFKAKYGLDKGAITPQNIDYYLNQVNTNDTLASRQAKKERATEALKKAASLATSAAQKVSAMKTAFNAGANKFILVSDFNAPQKIFNAVNNSLVPSGKTQTFKKGQITSLFGLQKIIARFDPNSISLSSDGGKTFFTFPPSIIVLQK